MAKLLPKFFIGQAVYSKVQRRSSSEPTWAPAGTKFRIKGIHRTHNGFEYICEDYDTYEFKENELMSTVQRAAQILKGGC